MMRRRQKIKFKEGDVVAFASHLPAKVYLPGGFLHETRLVVVDRSGHRYRVRSTNPVGGFMRDGWFYEEDLVMDSPVEKMGSRK